MCSSTRGPAMLPSLVTWPMRITGMSVRLARLTKSEVHSRTCVTDPGAELTSSLYTVWMESTAKKAGCSSSTCRMMACTEFSAARKMLSLRTASRSARIRIWRTDSSPLA